MALFGTNGVRGIVNEDLTPEKALDLARSLAVFLSEREDADRRSAPVVVLGTDTRISGMMLKSAAASGLLASGIAVIDAGVVPTPSLQYYVKSHPETAAGIIVTASHNPREYNGIKFIDGDGTEFSRDDEKRVEDIYTARRFTAADWSKTGEIIFDLNCNDEYLAGILEIIDRKSIEKKKFKVLTDTGNGAGSLTMPKLMSALGCHVLALGAQPDGTFPWRNPEPLPEALSEATAVMRSSDFDLGVAQDGDADRAVFIDENGDFIDDEIMLAAVEKYILHKEKGPVVTTVSTSQRFTDIAKDEEADVYYTPVGSVDVGRRMVEVGAVFGGEGNGGIIYPRHQVCRDGAMAAALVLEMLAHTGMKASEIKDTVPTYFNEKFKIRLPDKDLKKVMASAVEEIISDRKEINYSEAERIDGLKLWFSSGWLLIRPSGTEPIIRITSEAKSPEDALKYLEIGKKYVNEAANQN
ncbi:Phosphoglucosamine mutase [Methanimicrococcus sp. At1]|uniref:Phosphoglucosamine mutase n=1 Tax=Methanimicrococcus hacksteinii TaxID=3028293 RepID=A0ABU3VNY0_9EURY|nr:phosphoglucosamine mutase [Methanimicrococcus sp. At1]MDV0445118.1 Phosphoglucosamine mutase [Methanimicrococcus sp. At1]